MEITASENILLAFFTANPWLGTSLDWLIKSALIIGLTVVLIRTFGN
ncbi:MAG: hypothetical protein QGG54_14730 [Gammaproteobacteria bacterium]|jgi:hypothetical protein|nr:hypothetical protein [Gammaproteobacteria bacterium]